MEEEIGRMSNLNLVQADLNIKVINERLALYVSTSDTEKLDILLGILEIESSACQVQANVIWEVLCG